jgi:hypothetical protein
VIVVAIVVTVFTAGVVAGATGGLMNIMATGATALAGGTGAVTAATGAAIAGASSVSAGMALGASIVGAAVGSIASQGVEMAVGVQDKFSWKQVALSAVSAGTTAGVGSQIASIPGNICAQAAAKAAIGNALTQAVGVATGLQKSFYWKGVAASAAGTVVGIGVNEASGLTVNGRVEVPKEFGERVALGTLSGVASGVTAAALRGGSVAVQQIAADAFGNAWGESLAYSSLSNVSASALESDQQRSGQEEAAFEMAPWAVKAQHNAPQPPVAVLDWDAAKMEAGGPATEAAQANTEAQQQVFRRGELVQQSADAVWERHVPNASARDRISDSATNAELTSYLLKQAGLNDDLVPTIGSGASFGSPRPRDAGETAFAIPFLTDASVADASWRGLVAGDGIKISPDAQAYWDLKLRLGIEDAGSSMSYGAQMRKVGGFFGDLLIGGVRGVDNLIPETLAFAYRMTGYSIAGFSSFINTDVSDRMFAQYERVTGRVFEYDNAVQAFGGLAAQLAAPTIFKGFSAGGSALYELEQSAKFTINHRYRHWLPGSSSVLEADTTFYAYKNSRYLQADYKPLQLWMSPDLMSSREAVQKLATPFATGYDTLLTVTLPAGTKIVTPRPVWSMFGRAGGGLELRSYSPVTQDMWKLSSPPK